MPWLLGIAAAVVVLLVVGVEKAKAAPKIWQVQLLAGQTLALSVKKGDQVLVQGVAGWTPPAVTSDSGALMGGNVKVLASTAQAITLQIVASGGTAAVESFGGPSAPIQQSIAGLNITITG